MNLHREHVWLNVPHEHLIHHNKIASREITAEQLLDQTNCLVTSQLPRLGVVEIRNIACRKPRGFLDVLFRLFEKFDVFTSRQDGWFFLECLQVLIERLNNADQHLRTTIKAEPKKLRDLVICFRRLLFHDCNLVLIGVDLRLLKRHIKCIKA